MKNKAPFLILLVLSISCHRASTSSERGPITEAEIKSTPDDQLQELILDEVDRRIDGDTDREREIVLAMPPGYRFIYAISILDEEVKEGGFHQYFWNSSDQFTADILEGLKAIGATKHEDLLRKAILIQENEKVVMEELKKKGPLEAFGESYKLTKLTPLDEEYKKCSEDINALSVKYIRNHPDLFVGK